MNRITAEDWFKQSVLEMTPKEKKDFLDSQDVVQLYQQLARYEDTGLEPKAIMELRKGECPIDNMASLMDNNIIEHSDCEDCLEMYLFKMKDQEHEFALGLSTILESLAIAQQVQIIPEIPEDWWSKVRNYYG